MKLFYKPGACSLASHIALCEIGGSFDIESVDTVAGQTASGNDYREINPKGYVPALQLDDGQILTEGPAILQYLADSASGSGLAPKTGTIARARMVEQLTFVSSEQSLTPIFLLWRTGRISRELTWGGGPNCRRLCPALRRAPRPKPPCARRD